jgi:hypothetical protein
MKKFEVNENYFDRIGQHKVVSINGNDASAIYVSGEKNGEYKNFDITDPIVARIHENVLEDLAPPVIKHSTISNYGANDVEAGEYCDSFTLEHIKKKVHVSVQIAAGHTEAEDSWFSEYESLTNEECPDDKVYWLPPNEKSKWTKMWYSTKVVFPWVAGLKINSSLNYRIKGNNVEVTRNAFTGFLLANGVKIGRN